jgi:hypothetical protein
MKPANAKAWDLLGKLERLADPANGGTLPEIEVANHKLQRLKSRFDFSGGRTRETMDIFAGLKVKRTVRPAAHLYTFRAADFDVANCVKWAIEKATGAACVFRGEALLAAVTNSTARKLAELALHIAQSFHSLLQRFGRLNGVTASDRSLFVRGLYDGMMNDARGVGELLPAGIHSGVRATTTKRRAPVGGPGLAIHPYSLAVALGRQIRFAAPLEEITAELERATKRAIGSASD